MTYSSCHKDCSYLVDAYNLFNLIGLDKEHLNGLNVWIGASGRDKTSVQMKNLYSCVLHKLGVNMLENDFDGILSGRVKYDVLLMFTFTPGTSARAIEIVVTSEHRKSSEKDKLYVYMPEEFAKGYISRKLSNHLIGGKLYYKDRLSFDRLDKSIFSKCVKHLIDIVNDKKTEMELIFNPEILIVTALPLEFAMMVKLLEDQRLDRSLGGNKSQYPHGKIGNKDVVVAMTGMGNNFSAAVVTNTLNKYPSIKYIFMTGIAGGIPYIESQDEHIRLGDIVVCNNQGVIQHDMGKNVNGQFEYNFSPRPPDATLLRNTSIYVELKGTEVYKYWENLDKLLKSKESKRPEEMDLCDTPWIENSVIQQPDVPAGYDSTRPRIHFGAIVSGNTVVKDANVRDKLKNDLKAKAIEMEGSGVADAAWLTGKSCFVVRGICDYANPNKNKLWQTYAAAAAAAFTHEIIEQTLNDS